MTTYSYAQLEGLWVGAGGSHALAPIMAAIALAESGGRSNALNAKDNGGKQSSFGIWQISNGTHSPPSANWANAQENAKLAVAKEKEQGLKAWGTFNSGAYKKFLRRGVNPIQSGTPPIQTVSSGGGILGGILGSLVSPDTIQRVGLVIFGGFVVIVGVMLLAGGHTMELVKATGSTKGKKTNDLS